MKDLPEFDLYWLGEPCRYNEEDKLLKSFPPGDLGGRYIGLSIGHSPQEIFDQTLPVLRALAQQSQRQAVLSGKVSAELPLINAVQMTWFFASKEISRLQGEVSTLEARIKKLEALNAS
jgi:hypothetical protein